jgi:hypothetical protein
MAAFWKTPNYGVVRWFSYGSHYRLAAFEHLEDAYKFRAMKREENPERDYRVWNMRREVIYEPPVQASQPTFEMEIQHKIIWC